MSGMFGDGNAHRARKSVEWYTPRWVFDDLGIDFDLDPASPHDMETCVPARTKFTVFENGLKQPWYGRVWLNPPYGPETGAWLRRMIHHGNGIALVFSRTDASWCQEAMKAASAMLFLSGRVEFVPGLENSHKASRSGAGTVLFAFGEDCASALRQMSHRGVFIASHASHATIPIGAMLDVGIGRDASQGRLDCLRLNTVHFRSDLLREVSP